MKEISVIFSILVFSFSLSQANKATHSPPTAEEDEYRAKVIAESAKGEHGLHPMVGKLNYGNYMKEVMKVLEDRDPNNKNMISEINDGQLFKEEFAKHINELPTKHRSKLDELKRLELQRIRHFAKMLKNQGENEKFIFEQVKELSIHLDQQHLTKFGAKDLRLLINTAAQDIKRMDQIRRSQYKQYEMHKRLELEELKKRLSPEELENLKNYTDQLLIKHKNLKPVHMPLSKAHLLQVWEERDQLSKDTFNIKTFFVMHDLDGNSFLDEDELKILIDTELHHVYKPDDADYDAREKYEETERMREYAFKHVDVDQNHLISLEEFIDFVSHHGKDEVYYWEILNQVNHFTNEEYGAYAKENRVEVNKLIDEGKITMPEAKRKPQPLEKNSTTEQAKTMMNK